jgi:CBS domain-containing protein
MRHSIMTERIARRGHLPPSEYAADILDQLLVRLVATPKVVTLNASQPLGEIRTWLASNAVGTSHQGFPVLTDDGYLTGVVTRRDLLHKERSDSTLLKDILRGPVRYTYDDCTVRQATDHLVNHNIGRLPVVSRSDPRQVVGILTRSDILSAYRRSIEEMQHAEPGLLKRSSTGGNGRG